MTKPTPVADDERATAPQLLARSGDDYATAQRRRDQLSGEDRINGMQTGGTR
ncbi:hypothetical protein OG742_37240 [Streptomyces sp. NBC_00828]|uniref:hypothetical protein n=1 Tax=Streptomyces sp. NBC_00828 TaxID=2903678 RepID=UPI003866F9F3